MARTSSVSSSRCRCAAWQHRVRLLSHFGMPGEVVVATLRAGNLPAPPRHHSKRKLRLLSGRGPEPARRLCLGDPLAAGRNPLFVFASAASSLRAGTDSSALPRLLSRRGPEPTPALPRPLPRKCCARSPPLLSLLFSALALRRTTLADCWGAQGRGRLRSLKGSRTHRGLVERLRTPNWSETTGGALFLCVSSGCEGRRPNTVLCPRRKSRWARA